MGGESVRVKDWFCHMMLKINSKFNTQSKLSFLQNVICQGKMTMLKKRTKNLNFPFTMQADKTEQT